MRILKNLRTAITATMLALSTSSCMQKAGGYVDMPENLMEPAVREVVDRVVAKTRTSIPDSTYKCFHKDTLYFHKDLIKKNGEAYMLDRLHDKAVQAVDSTTHETIPVVVPKKKKIGKEGKQVIVDLVEKNIPIRSANHLDPQAVIASDKILTRDSVNFYLPVEYYGIPNSELGERAIRLKSYLESLPRYMED